MSIVSVTGHRPHKLGGYGKATEDALYLVAYEALEQMKPDAVVSGMALGWDQAVVRACLDLNIPYTAALPFPGQEDRWPKETQTTYHEYLKQAAHIQIVNPPPYRPHKLHERNEWMVTHSDKVLALWDGARDGRTYQGVRYAMVCGKPIYNAWGLFSKQETHLTRVDKI